MSEVNDLVTEARTALDWLERGYPAEAERVLRLALPPKAENDDQLELNEGTHHGYGG